MPNLIPQAAFVTRGSCINCISSNLSVLSKGSYSEEPLRSFLAADPWGVDPLPHLRDAKWTLVRCNDCNQVFHRQILDETWNERRFTEWMSEDAIRRFEAALGTDIKRNAAIHHVEHVLRIERLTKALRTPGEAVTLLDFGCGFGSFLECCQQFGFNAVGVDRATPRRDGAAVKIHADLTELADQQFHAVTLFEVLEHVDHPLDILKMLQPRIVPGGILVLETPDCTGVSAINNLSDYRKIHPLEHINAFTNATLRSIAQRAGFQPIRRGAAFVTAEKWRVIKTVAKSILRRGETSTQLYFRKP